MAEIKKTMVDALAFVTENGNMSKDNLELFTNKFCVKVSRSGESKPREITKLYDAEGNLLAGRCSATKLWFKAADFNHHHGLSKQAQNVKARRNTEAKTIETEALSFLSDARELTDPTEKLKAFEDYDVEMSKAQDIRKKPITVKDFTEEVEHYDSIEAVAGALGVEVITEKPKAEEAEEAEEVE